MLISMPTGTSAIFGVFQVIRVSQVVWRDVAQSRTYDHPGRSARAEDRGPNTNVPRVTADISLPDKAISLLDKLLPGCASLIVDLDSIGTALARAISTVAKALAPLGC